MHFRIEIKILQSGHLRNFFDYHEIIEIVVNVHVHSKLKLKTFLQSWKLCQRHFQGQIIRGSANILVKLQNSISFANELLGVNSIVLSFAPVTCNNCLTNRFPFRDFSYFSSFYENTHTTLTSMHLIS